MITIKQDRCKKCGRPINHEGNCLKCNLIIKLEREKKITAGVPESEDILLSEILKIKSADHKEIQLQIQSIFRSLGYFAEIEREIKATKKGYIDLVANKSGYWVGLEIDHASLRFKSIDKLNHLNPDLAIFVLKGKKIDPINMIARLKLIKVKSILVHLPGKVVTRLK